MRVQLKGGDAASINAYAGPAGELVVNTDTRDIHSMDGINDGGNKLSGPGLAFTVSAPSITSPLTGAILGLGYVNITTGLFIGDGLHVASAWEIATDAGFSNIVHDSGDDANSLTEYNVSDHLPLLAPETVHYVRCRHISSAAGVSAWSVGIDFITGKSFPSIEIGKIALTDPMIEDYFGTSVALNAAGNVCVVGVKGRDVNGIANAGAAYVYTRINGAWVLQSELLEDTVIAGNLSSDSVAINGDGTIIMVGSRYRDWDGLDNSGIVTVYTLINSVWTHQQILHSDNPTVNDYFGQAMAMNTVGDLAIIGSSYFAGSGTGSVYVFTRTGTVWTQQHKFSAGGDEQQYDNFGHALALSADGTIALIGADGEDDTYTDTGSAYIYSHVGGIWTQQQKLHASGPVTSDRFGSSVALNAAGNKAFIGCPYDDDGGLTDSGSVYVFTETGGVWGQIEKVHPLDPADSDGFGVSVAMNGDGTIGLVGASWHTDVGLSKSGTVYVFI